ncbi:Putative aminophospholipid-translocase [Desmophyllum pertusum]|uniref:Aminophospholipid-translocase n=1 Tax=Desmophyllum pertusum TaxID=174260 RepID=A0A9X0CN16_9CNID|nr:Putative aminophospholipid-translocase [Desmophyllum pertusum]
MALLSLFQVFLERIGCFSIEKELVNSLQYQRPTLDRRFHPVHACASAAWSRGLKIFAVRNGSECLGDKNISAILPRLSASGGCLGGRGGQNVTDIYRFTTPSRAPDLVTAYNTSSTSLVVRWSHVKKQYFYGQPIGYKIVYYPLDLESDVISVSVNYTTNITTLADLAVYTMYVINVSAISSGGVGPAKTTKARTGAIAPSRAPDMVTSYNTSSTSLVPIGYKIVYYPLDLESDVISVSVNNTTNITTLADLAVYTMYVINVSAISSGGVGPAKTTKARTGAIDLVDATSSTSLNITWSSVPEQHRHGEILMYLVYISRADAKNDYRTFRALQPTQYEIVPSAAPMNLRSVHRDSSFIIVEWDPIPKGSENGILQGYKVVYMALSRYADLETNHDDYSAVSSWAGR